LEINLDFMKRVHRILVTMVDFPNLLGKIVQIIAFLVERFPQCFHSFPLGVFVSDKTILNALNCASTQIVAGLKGIIIFNIIIIAYTFRENVIKSLSINKKVAFLL
jgi:hypothetical protein